MTLLTRRSGIAVLLLALGAGSLAGASVAPAAVDQDASAIGSTCVGPGRVTLEAEAPRADGTVRVELSADGLLDGSRWEVFVGGQRGRYSDNAEFRRTATGGDWVARATLAPRRPGAPLTNFTAAADAGRRGLCIVLLSTPSPTFGASLCSNNLIPLVDARQRNADGSLVLRFLAFGSPDARWRVELQAIARGGTQIFTANTVVGPRAVIRTRAELEGVDDPRLRVIASGPGRQRCVFRLNPANITTDPLPPAADLRRALRELQREASARRR